jgi:hypothetical protein
MQQNGLTEIISTDHGYDHIQGITRLDPAQLFRHLLPLPDQQGDPIRVIRG